jgi:hypothetical protein
MRTKTQNHNKEVGMRNIIGTAVAVVLSMMLLPSCCSTANAGVSVSVSIGASAGYPGEGYVYEDWDDEAMDWDNVYIVNDNIISMWVLLDNGTRVLRCRSMWYNSGTYEWTFGPWWYDYSVSYNSPFSGVKFHTYMNLHYRDWHNRYFVYSQDRYQPRVERHIIVNRGRYIRNNKPAVYRHPATIEKVLPGRTMTPQKTTVITRETKPPVRINDVNHTERVQQSAPATPERTTTITRTKEIKQPVSNSGGNRTEKINSNQGNSRQTEMTKTRTTTQERSNGNGNSSTRTKTMSSTRTQQRGR